MAKLTNDQIEKLTPEQQEMLGELKVRRHRKHLALLENAQGYRGYAVLQSLPILVITATFGYFHHSSHTSLFLVTIVLFALIQFHATGLNRRLDALMDLLEHDIKQSAEKGDSDDDHTA